MSRLTRHGTAEPVSRDQILRHEREQGNIHFLCLADHVQDWQPSAVDPYSCSMCVTIHTTYCAAFFIEYQNKYKKKNVEKSALQISDIMVHYTSLPTSSFLNSIILFYILLKVKIPAGRGDVALISPSCVNIFSVCSDMFR